jgi:hypothetical protein
MKEIRIAQEIHSCIGYLARPFQRQDEKTASIILQPPPTRGRLMPPF